MIRQKFESGSRPESCDRCGVGQGRLFHCLCVFIVALGITGCQPANQPVENLAVPISVSTVTPQTFEDPEATLALVVETLPVTATAIRLILPSIEPTRAIIPLTAATATLLPTQTDMPTLTATESLTVESPQPSATHTVEPTDLPTSTPTATLASATPTANETATSTPIEVATETPADMTPTVTVDTGVTVVAVQDTTCRRYPMRNSNPLGNLVVNSAAVVEGQDTSGEWFFISNPTNPVERMCWVWSGTLTIVGDISSLEIIPDSIND